MKSKTTSRSISQVLSPLLAFALAGSPLAVMADDSDGPKFLDVKIDVNLNLRADEKDLLVSDGVIPAGSIVQVPVKEFQEAKSMPYWKYNHKNELDFVKGIKILSSPGLSKAQIDHLNQWRATEGLYMAKSYLGNAELVDSRGESQSVTLGRETPVFRNDGATEPPPTTETQQKEEEKQTAGAIIDQVEQVNKAKPDPANSYAGCNKDFIKKWVADGVPARAIAQSLNEMQKNPKGLIHNRRYLTIVDFTKPSSERRMYVLDTQNGGMKKLFTSNGRGSDGPANKAVRFSNQPGSYATPAGFHVTGFADASGVHTTQGFHKSPVHGKSLLLIGLEDKNNKSASRDILIHGAWYARESFVQQTGRVGRSEGCLAIDPAKIDGVLNEIEGGSLVYNYTGA